jgi:hypothetical protein
MKLVLFLFTISCCFADISPESDPIYQEVWKLFKKGKQDESTKKCLEVLNDTATSNIDRLHFLVSLTIFRNEEKDREEIQNLIKTDRDCLYEYRLYYN